MTPPRPNFLWISLEDCSPTLGCYGDRVARSPNIDRLASEGTLYKNACCTSPVCSPSRTAVITGFPATAMAAHQMRTTFQAAESPGLPTPYQAVPPPFVKCFTETLRKAGYYCSNNGKTDYQFAAPPFAWDANGKPQVLAEIHWRHRLDPAQPFFAVFNLEDTHESRMWPDMPRLVEGDLEPVEPTDPAALEVPPFLPDTPEVRVALARQYNNVAHNDRLVGLLLAQLAEDGLAENTVVMLWSDHGEGIPRAKRFLYESGLRVPLIIRAPGRFAAGKVEERPVSLLDLAPTVFELAGVPQPVHFAGVSLLAREDKNFVFAHRDRTDGEYDKARSVRSGRLKLIRNYFAGQERFGYSEYRGRHAAMQAIRACQIDGDDTFDQPAPPVELFDLEGDPDELHNLADDPTLAPQRRELEAALDAWTAKYDPDLNVPEDQIAARVWPSGLQPVTAQPIAILFHHDDRHGTLVAESAEIPAPGLLQLNCSTEGATIGYRFQNAETWRIYQQPLRLAAGTHVFELRAARYGYAPSETRRIRIQLH